MSAPLTFVAFYMEVSDATMDRIHETTSTITVTEPHRFIAAMFASARLFHPDCRRVILTDEGTRFPPDTDAEVLRMKLDAGAPMLSRAKAWLAFLRLAEGHIVLLDNDILINGDLSHVFADDFAVALTCRAGDKKWPINAGVNFAHGDYLADAAAFHALWLARFQEMDAAGVWGGDQDALREMFSDADFERSNDFFWRLGDIAVRFLPCAKYNFSTRRAEDMTGRYPDALALHFKGRRKPFMLPYFERHLRPPSVPPSGRGEE